MKSIVKVLNVVLICAFLGLEAWYFGLPQASEKQWKFFVVISIVNLLCFWARVWEVWKKSPVRIAYEAVQSIRGKGEVVVLNVGILDFIYIALQPTMFVTNLGYLLVSRP